MKEYKIIKVRRDWIPYLIYERSKVLWIFWSPWKFCNSRSSYADALDLIEELTTESDIEVYRTRASK